MHSWSLFWCLSASPHQVLAASCQNCRRWFYSDCLFCFCGAGERQAGSDLTGKSDLKTHHVFKSFLLCQPAKGFWGHYLGQWQQGGCTLLSQHIKEPLGCWCRSSHFSVMQFKTPAKEYAESLSWFCSCSEKHVEENRKFILFDPLMWPRSDWVQKNPPKNCYTSSLICCITV